MASFNQLTIIGNLGRDPELRFTQDGTPVASFSVAVNNPFKKDDPPLWVKCSAWRKQAEACGQYLSKGDTVMVVGRLSLEEWQSRDGENKAQCAVDAQSVIFLPRGDSDGGFRAAAGGRNDDGPPPAARDVDSLPFE